MDKPVLVIMAAGMGSRYGGLKQIDPVDEQGNKIIDFSIYDAVRAGFSKVIFIIKKENEQDFRLCIGDVVKDHIDVEYAFQELTDIPEGMTVPEGRVKPWGTAHAVLSARRLINGPFAVINADDFYGREAFKIIYDYLVKLQTEEEKGTDIKLGAVMVGYELKNTLTENGYVSRGVCSTDKDGYLTAIVERTHIEKKDNGAAYTEDEGQTYVDIADDSIVSMNMWGFTQGFVGEAVKSFEMFFKNTVPLNPLKAECYLPGVVDELLKEDRATVKVLKSADRWFGVTYKEDKPFVAESIKALKEKGEYPEELWQ
ncbi:MAG: nucleotidyltransferase [Lachnospiraceae bacterium]|nr:nucleotidyltransferase [Lachnospiraceae bacterium]